MTPLVGGTGCSPQPTPLWLQEKALPEGRGREIEVNAAKARGYSREAVEKFCRNSWHGCSEIGLLTVAEEEVARKFWPKSARTKLLWSWPEYSDDEWAKQGGYVGLVTRTGLPEAASAAVFGAAEGEVVGPFELETGYSLIRVIGQHPAVLDDRRESEIRSVLFQNFLAEQESKAKINWAI